MVYERKIMTDWDRYDEEKILQQTPGMLLPSIAVTMHQKIH